MRGLPRLMIAWSVTILVSLLVLSALFSAMETAYTSLSPGQIGHMAESRGKRGQLVKRLTDRPDILLTTLLIGNNLANLGASALATAVTIRVFGNAYVAVATGVLTLAVLVFCEVTPKQIALATNDKLALVSARAILFLSWTFRPVIWVVGAISGTMTKWLAGEGRPSTTLENIIHHVKVAEGHGVVESFEEEMVRNVFRINDTPAEALMTHRTELFFLDEECSASEAFAAFLESGHSRAPVLKGDSEHVVGILGWRKLARAAEATPELAVKKLVIPPFLVPGTIKAHELFFRMKDEGRHMAVVLDEYGGLDGVVTREDVMEEIFGELNDINEAPVDDPIVPDKEGTWIIQGDTDFYDVRDILGLDLAHDSRTHTMSGYVLEHLGSIPAPGVVLSRPEGRYEILEVVKNRIVSIRFEIAENDGENGGTTFGI